ncbi:MAG: hypothetical protein ACREXP_17470, partial [Steroidobacteraceae bacterium]
MQAVDSLSARSPSVAYWISLGLVPVAFLLIMALIDRAPPIDPALLRSKFRIVASESEQPPQFPQQVPPEDFTGAVDYTPVNASNIASIWYQVEVETSAPTRDLWAAYFPTTYGTYAVYVNGSLVGPTSPLRPPYEY